MSTTLTRAAALAIVLGAAALTLPAYADDHAQWPQDSATPAPGVGSVEGYGGFAGRVGSTVPDTRQEAREPVDGSATGVEGYGGFAGRIGQDSDVRSAKEVAPR